MLEVAQSIATSDLRRAIAIAKVIPANTTSYSSAQSFIQQWQQQLNPRQGNSEGNNGLPN